MVFLQDLQNTSPNGLTCADAPFLPGCADEVRSRQNPRYAQPPTRCVVGTITGSYANGDPFMGNVVERSRRGYPDRVFRDVVLPSGITFQLRNRNRSDETFEQVSDGEQVALDLIQPGLVGTVHLHTDDANLCRSMAYHGGIVVPSIRAGYRGHDLSQPICRCPYFG